MPSHSPFHEGKLEVQMRAGEEATAEANSPMIISQIYSGALSFIRQQQMAVLSTRDADGRRWASLVFGPKGFLEPNGVQLLNIAVPAAGAGGRDPLPAKRPTHTRLRLACPRHAHRPPHRAHQGVGVVHQ